MSVQARRVCHVKGSPWQVGFDLGRALGDRLAQNIERYIQTGPARQGAIDLDKLRAGALPWLRHLPQRFQQEFEGLAQGSGVPLQRLAEWCYVEECVGGGCSSLVCTLDGQAWVARNNDLWAPDMWGYVTIREVEGRIPTVIFGLEGEIFAGTGVSRERLWLHYNWLPSLGGSTSGKPHLPAYVWLTEALETCRDIAEVEALLGTVDREGGMLLFAVDGRVDEWAVFECAPDHHVRREPMGEWIAGTNHYVALANPSGQVSATSRPRLQRMKSLLAGLYAAGGKPDLPGDLVCLLADPGVEARDEDYGTVYANVACPGLGAIWYTFGGYPAASAGAWDRLEWPW
jgi:hypothetical protein